MRPIPFITSSKPLLERVTPIAHECEGFDAELAFVGDVDQALDYLDVEIPDLAFINFSDPLIDSFGMLETVLQDPWLHHASIVAFCDDNDTVERIEKMRSANIVACLADDDIERYLPKILGIIVKNQRILYQRSFGADLVQTLSGSFQLHNDTTEANCYANLLCNFLYNANKIDADGKMHVNIALTEMLINGIEHGNCGITYTEKSAWLEEGNMMRDLIAKKCEDAAVAAKRVTFEYTVAPDKSTFHIADEGPGFDWRALKDPAKTENLSALHGRGIKMTRRYTKNLQYNDAGNSVTFDIEHQADCANGAPAVFDNIPPITVKPGDVVFQEGEPGDFLYYIAKGRFEVIKNGEAFTSLSADDILMGEMAFLLNNRRTATVRAKTAGTLIRMSKRDFVDAIKRKPHYGLVLARLLAHRVRDHHPATL